jgi:hypothetical protein
MRQPSALGRGERAAGLERFVGQQLGRVGGGQQAGLDLGVVEDAAGDQAVQADAGLVQGVVAQAFGCAGDVGQLLVEAFCP